MVGKERGGVEGRESIVWKGILEKNSSIKIKKNLKEKNLLKKQREKHTKIYGNQDILIKR